jgi:UDP-2,3-diacylglucosamine pyrophosphatase LpxH
MLVFISDIHFVDETAGEHNIPPAAFEGVFQDLKKYGGKPEEIKIIFLGDIFDLNRTTYWLDKPESERPWGVGGDPAKVEAHANKIFDDIIQKNAKTFEILKGSLKDRFQLDVEPERIYIPGNHDRLCNMYATLRVKVRTNMGISAGNPQDGFLHMFADKNSYKVIAWHGHEFDVMNYEGAATYTEADYVQVPIGDLITTEIAARLPYAIMKHVDEMNPPLPIDERENLKKNFEQIENVRPYSALFDWLFYHVSEKPNLKKEINEAIKDIVNNFNNLPYLKRWYKRHDKWNVFTSDEADKLQQAMRLFKLFDIDAAENLMKIYSKIYGSPDDLPMDNSDKVLIDKAREFLTHTSEYRYCVMGHTHNPMQVPIRVTSAGLEQMYLNTGTWRKRYVKGQAGGFIGLKNLTYTTIYSEQESKKQRFETWTGSLKEDG